MTKTPASSGVWPKLRSFLVIFDIFSQTIGTRSEFLVIFGQKSSAGLPRFLKSEPNVKVWSCVHRGNLKYAAQTLTLGALFRNLGRAALDFWPKMTKNSDRVPMVWEKMSKMAKNDLNFCQTPELAGVLGHFWSIWSNTLTLGALLSAKVMQELGQWPLNSGPASKPHCCAPIGTNKLYQGTTNLQLIFWPFFYQ